MTFQNAVFLYGLVNLGSGVSDLGSQRNLVFSPSSLHMSHSLKDGCTNMRVPSRLLTRNTDRFSILCWKSSHSSVPLTELLLMAWKICSSLSGCSEARATLSSGRALSKDDCVRKRMLHCRRYTSARLTGTTL